MYYDDKSMREADSGVHAVFDGFWHDGMKAAMEERESGVYLVDIRRCWREGV